MDYPTIYKKAFDVIREGSLASWEKIKGPHKNELTAAAVKDIGLDAIERIYLTDDFKNKLIEVLEEEDFKDRNILLKELGELVVKAAMEGSKRAIEENLEEVLPIVAEQDEESMRLSLEEDSYEYWRLNSEDNHQQI